jgi:hypothetical protein
MENTNKTAQEAAEKIPKMAQDTANSLGKAFQNLADNLAPVMDKLAGTQSNVRLSFDDLTFDTGTAKAKITGSINLEVSYSNQQQAETQPQASEPTRLTEP